MLANYLIKNGTILSVLSGGQKQADIRVTEGIIKEIAPRLSSWPGETCIDASGLLLTVGWVDGHCHFGTVGDGIGVDESQYLLPQGVTYAVDPGTAGPDNFEAYRRSVRFKSDLEYRAYINMGLYGINKSRKDTEGPQDVDVDRVRQLCKQYPDEILGLKIRIDSLFCYDALALLTATRSLADELGCPMVVHAPRCDLPIEEVLSFLKAGDVFAHTFAGRVPHMIIVDENGAIRPCVKEARARGIVFDLSHGTNAFSYAVAEQAWRQGFLPDIISSDLWQANVNGPVYNLATVITKMRGVTQLDWPELLRRVTVTPAQLLHLPGKQLEIEVGKPADLTAFAIETGEFVYVDSAQEERICHERLCVRYTAVGKKIYCNF